MSEIFVIITQLSHKFWCQQLLRSLASLCLKSHIFHNLWQSFHKLVAFCMDYVATAVTKRWFCSSANGVRHSFTDALSALMHNLHWWMNGINADNLLFQRELVVNHCLACSLRLHKCMPSNWCWDRSRDLQMSFSNLCFTNLGNSPALNLEFTKTNGTEYDPRLILWSQSQIGIFKLQHWSKHCDALLVRAVISASMCAMAQEARRRKHPCAHLYSKNANQAPTS